MDKFLLFTTGGCSANVMGLDSNEVALYNSADLRTIKPTSKSTLDLKFRGNKGEETVTLNIKGGSHTSVMRSIAEALENTNYVITIADVDTNNFIDVNIVGCTIRSQQTYIQTLTGNSRTQLSIPTGNIESCMICNIDGTDAVDLSLELHDGSTYTSLLSTISIPTDNTLKLESDEISFDNSVYNLYATSGDANGQLTFTFNY